MFAVIVQSYGSSRKYRFDYLIYIIGIVYDNDNDPKIGTIHQK
jgi:hypothetical protein